MKYRELNHSIARRSNISTKHHFLGDGEGNSTFHSSGIVKPTLHLLRKEFVYTKLKYSRSPAFDIVSGGSAALLAAFFGFLISEKFGIELVDSGDFYYLNMYLVIFAYALKTFKDVLCVSQTLKEFVLLHYLCKYYVALCY